VIDATAKVSIDAAGVHEASTGFEQGKYLLLGDLSKLKNSVDKSKECIHDGSNLLTVQEVKATSYERVIEQPVNRTLNSTFIWYVTLRRTIYIFLHHV